MRYTMSHGSRFKRLPEKVLKALQAAVIERQTAAFITPHISKILGTDVHPRTVGRWMTAIRIELRGKQVSSEQSLAIAACEDGNLTSISRLAESITLDPGWRDRREKTIAKAFHNFRRFPTPLTLTALRVESFTFLFEVHISKSAGSRETATAFSLSDTISPQKNEGSTPQ